MAQGPAPAHEVSRNIGNLSPPTGPFSVSSSRPLRILHIITDLSVAGAEMKLYKLLAATNRERFAPSVISMRDHGELRERIEALGIPVYSLGIRGAVPGLGAIRRLVRIVRQTRPDVIHGWMYHANLAAQFAAAFAKTRPSVLWSVHQSLYSFVYEKWFTAMVIKVGVRLSQRSNKIVYPSRTSAKQHEAVGFNKGRTMVLPYGFDTEKFAPSEEARLSLRHELGVPEDTLLIGLIGRYHPVKDHANFLRAAQIVSENHAGVRFVLCGKGVDQNNAALRTLIGKRQLMERTHLLGERRDIQRIMAALDITCSSSCSEGFPNVVGEAMSSGVPCVVTDVSDLPEILGATGTVVPPGDSAALAVALEDMVALGQLGRQALGAAARTRVIERYSLESSISQYEALYESMTARTSPDNQQRYLVPEAGISGIR